MPRGAGQGAQVPAPATISRTVAVDVNGEESRLSLIEVEEEGELASTEELNPDCYVVVYAVDDEQSFGERGIRQTRCKNLKKK